MNRDEGQIVAGAVPTKRKRRLAIGIVTHQISGATAWWLGAAEVARQQNVDLFILNASDVGSGGNITDNRPDAVHHLIDPERLDGLILVQWWPSRQVFEAFYERYYRPLPVVNLHRHYEGYSGVMVDNYQSMMAMLRHLIEVHGYRRLAYIGGLPDNPSASARYAAYVATLAEYDIPLDENLVLPGDFSPQAGINAVHVLLDERGLRPKLDFEVIVASNDYMAVTALEELQRRGVRVPLDVALVGFDDMANSAHTVPPLTTVRMPNYEMGRVAAEIALAAVKGQPFDEFAVVPGELMIRQSCGCFAPPLADVSKAARMPLPLPEGSPGGPFTGPSPDQRARIVAELWQSVGPAGQILGADWAEEILAAFDAVMSSPPDDQLTLSNRFLGVFYIILRQLHLNGYNLLRVGRMILFTLRRCLQPMVIDTQQLRRAEGVWQQAMAFVIDMEHQLLSSQQYYGTSYIDQLRVIGERLITTFEMTQLLDLIAGELPRVNIPGVYIALYMEPTRQLAKLALAYNKQGRNPSGVEGQIFRARQLVPEGLLSQNQPSVMIIVPLYFQDTALGFVLFEIGPEQDEIYETLGRQISSALQGALLVRRLQERTAELTRQQYVLNTFMENVPDRIYFKDLDSNFTRVNKAHTHYLGLSDPIQEIGKSDWDFFPKEQAQAKYEQEQQIIRTGQPILGLEEPDGAGHWALTTKMPLRDEHGAIIGTFGISHDITELKQAQAELQRSYADVEQRIEERTAELQREIAERKQAEAERETLIAELETKNAELERFTYTVSHDLKSPLITIGGFVGFLEKDALTGNQEQIKADMTYINDAVTRMQRLLDELLELSRIGRLMYPPQKVPFENIAREAVELVRGRITAHGIMVEIAPDLPTVYGDRVRLVEVVQNLVDNAIKFIGNQPHPHIEIGTRQDKNQLVFYVHDNGSGIETQYQEQVFGLFNKLDPTSEGTGIGLALVKRIIETHGGTIWVESEGTGRGSSFCFTLPPAPQ
jgi:PAS domain S-box-containing protein